MSTAKAKSDRSSYSTPVIELAVGIGIGADSGKLGEDTKDTNGERADEENGQGTELLDEIITSLVLTFCL